jgi:hypothetical protein
MKLGVNNISWWSSSVFHVVFHVPTSGGELVDTLLCAISQLSHGCRCNLVRECEECTGSIECHEICLHNILFSALSSLLMVILLFHPSFRIRGNMELTLLCDVICIALWRYAAECCAEGAPVWSSFGEWGRLFVSRGSLHGSVWMSELLTFLFTGHSRLHPECSPCVGAAYMQSTLELPKS